MSSCIRLFLARSTRFMPHLVLILMMASLAMPAVLVSGNARSVSAEESSAPTAITEDASMTVSSDEEGATEVRIESGDGPAPVPQTLPERSGTDTSDAPRRT